MAEFEEPIEDLRQEPPGSTLHILRVVPIVIVVGLLIHFLLPRLVTIEGSLQTLHTMKPWAIVLAMAMETLSYMANGELLRSVVALTGEHISFRRAAAIEIAAGTVAIVAAGALGFGASIYRWTRDSGITERAAMLASWLPSLFDSASLVLFALASAVELLRVHELSHPMLIALVVVIATLVALIASAIVLLARNKWLVALSTFLARVIRRIRPSADDVKFVEAAERTSHTWQTLRRGGWVRPAISSLLVVVFDLLSLRYAFLAAGQHPHFTLLLAGYGVPLLLGRASFVPGGIAVIEIAMAAIFGGLGIPGGAAVVIVLVYRLISFWLPALIGIPIAVGLQYRKRHIAVA